MTNSSSNQSNNANNHANPATSAAAAKDLAINQNSNAFVPRQLPTLPGRSQSPPKNQTINVASQHASLVHENVQIIKTAVSPSVIQNQLSQPQANSGHAPNATNSNQTLNTNMKHSQSPPQMNAASSKPARPQNFTQRPSQTQPNKPNVGPTRPQTSSEDNEDTMKNLRKTFAGIFGDI